MERHWFWVCDEQTHWEIRDHKGALTGSRHTEVDPALSEAIQLARQEWRVNRLASGVRVQSRSGPSHDVTTFGELAGDGSA